MKIYSQRNIFHLPEEKKLKRWFPSDEFFGYDLLPAEITMVNYGRKVFSFESLLVALNWNTSPRAPKRN